MNTAVYTVKGMTCSSCMNKVIAAVSDVEGVKDVDVDISNGQLTVTGHEPVNGERIRDAIQRIGYEVAS